MAQQLRPGGRKSRQWNLGEELKGRLRPMHFSAPFGILGVSGTGRKTLALRFAAMEADGLPQQTPQPFYSSFHVRTVRPQENLRPITLHLNAYIYPTPEGSTSDPDFHRQEWNRFCCLVFLFDITRKGTFNVAKAFMNLYGDLRIKHLLVGNKCDLRVIVSQRSLVARTDVEAEASRRGIKYYECSARMKLNVQSLLEDIQECALQQTYMMDL